MISAIGYIYCDTYVKGIKRQPEQKWQPRYTQEEWQQIEIERNSEQFERETAQEFETETGSYLLVSSKQKLAERVTTINFVWEQ